MRFGEGQDAGLFPLNPFGGVWLGRFYPWELM